MPVMADATALETPILLLAMPQVDDVFFRKTVVLLVRHDEDEGSLGFIVNKPTELRVAEILEDNEIPWSSEDVGPFAFFGGPVNPEIGTLLYQAAEDSDEHLAPGIAASQSLTDLESLAHAPSSDFRLYLGYAGWGTGQLEQEILRNDWLIAPVRPELIFADDTDEVWHRAVESVGIEPETLPAWTHTSEPVAN